MHSLKRTCCLLLLLILATSILGIANPVLANPASSQATLPVTTENGTVVDFVVSGDITPSQISNATISTNQSKVTFSFVVAAEGTSARFSNITIPKSAVSYASAPVVYIDNQSVQDQGNTQDANDYYVWFSTDSMMHSVSIVFTANPSPTPSVPEYQASAIVGIAVLTALAAVLFSKRKRQN